ncbi:MAG: carbohydrate porin [Kofleriaceae bacterium]
MLGASHASAQPQPDPPAPANPVETPAPAPLVTPSPSSEPPPEGEPPTSSPLEPTPPLPPPPPRPTTGEPTTVVAPDPDVGFRFGSYGRVIAGDDLHGGKPERIAIVAHSPRIVEDSYLELDTSYGFRTPQGLLIRPVITLAFDGTLFHDTGEFDAHPALRNMFLDAQITPELSAWVGSRMYRGDDIYLLDFWPLDDLNTVGGGVLYRRASHELRWEHDVTDVLELAAHAGVNRLDHPFQYQTIDVANPVQGATTVVQLNRQRMIASASAAYTLGGPSNDVSTKLKLHGELHALPSGSRKRDDGTFEDLPSDHGYLIGAEVSFFNLGGEQLDSRYRRHINVFARYAQGLAAFDELAPPTTFGPDLETTHANELTLGASGNWDAAVGNAMIALLTRRFVDATGNASDPENGWEYVADLRPLAKLGKGFFAGADVSYQARFPQGLNAITLRAEDPAVFQIAPMLVFSPMGPSGYDRPQLRLVYRAAHLNEGARDLYVPDDPRHGHEWVHFIGFEAEWWFNSTTYKR